MDKERFRFRQELQDIEDGSWQPKPDYLNEIDDTYGDPSRINLFDAVDIRGLVRDGQIGEQYLNEPFVISTGRDVLTRNEVERVRCLTDEYFKEPMKTFDKSDIDLGKGNKQKGNER